jgi:amino acid transporter
MTQDLAEQHQKLGASQLVFFVIAAAAPLGFSVGTIPLAIGRGSTAYALAIIATAVILAIFSVGYVTMAGHMKRMGGLYEFVNQGLGKSAGTGASFVALLTYAVAGTGAIGVFAVLAQGSASDLLHIHLSWWVWGFAGCVLMGVLGLLNVDLNARVLGFVMVAEISILLIVSIAVTAKGGAHGLTAAPFEPSVLLHGSVGTSFALAVVAFAGFEATVIYSSEVRNRKSSITRATFASLIVMTLIYAFVSWALVAAFGQGSAAHEANTDPVGMFYTMTHTYVGSWLLKVVEVMVVTSWFASIVAFHNATARYLASMGRDRIVPAWFGALARNGAPRRASLTHTALTIAAVVLTLALHGDPYNDLFVLGSTPALMGIPGLELAASIAIIVYFARDRQSHHVVTVFIAPAVAAVLLGAMLWEIIAQLALFTGQGTAVNTMLWGVVAGAFLLGALRGRFLKDPAPAPDEPKILADVAE